MIKLIVLSVNLNASVNHSHDLLPGPVTLT